MALSGNIRAGRAFVEIVGDSSKLQKELTNAQAQLRAFSASTGAIGRDLLTVATAAAVPLAYATKSFADFDDSMRLVQAVTRSTGKEFEALTKRAAQLGRDTSYTAKQAADAMVALGRMGFDAREIDQASGAVLNLARSTGTDLAEAADFAANSLRIFGLNASEMTRISDTLTATANGSAQTLTDLFEGLKIAGPQAKAANESIEDTCASLGVLANMGIKGSLAGTALRKSYSQFASADVQDTLAEWGISTVDAEGNLRRLADVMRDIAVAMQQMPTAERLAFAEDIFDIRGSLAGLSLTGNVKELDAFIASLRNVEGVAAQTAEKMDAGLGGSFRLLTSAVEGAVNSLGSQLAVALQPMIQNITSATKVVIAWIDANGSCVRGIATLLVSVGGLSVSFLALSGVSRAFAGTLSLIQGATRGISAVFSGIATAANGAVGAFKLMGNAFRTYADASVPALVGTSRLLAALRLPIDSRAKQVAASLLLMSRAETASAARTMLATKYQATIAVLQKFRLSTMASVVAMKAQSVAEALTAVTSKAVAVARTVATVATHGFTGATVRATVASTASAGANLALAATTKVLAGGYLAASMAAKALVRIPIAAVFTAAAVAVIGLYTYLARAGKYTAKLTNKMQSVREEGDQLRQEDALRMQRLEQLAEKQKLSNAELNEAERLSKTLTGRYGELGITIDTLTGSLNIAANAQERLTAAMKKSAIAQLEAEIAEYRANIKELDREIQACQHWSNYNLWSYMSGGMDEALGKMETAYDKQSVYMQKISNLYERIRQIEEEGTESSLFGTDEATELQTSIGNEQIKKEESKSDAENASKRALEIEKQLRRENQSELENEIEDIIDLKKEYVSLIQTMLRYEESKRQLDHKRIEDLKQKLQEAEEIAQQRISKAQERKQAEDAEGVKEVQHDFKLSMADFNRSRNEETFDANLSQLKKDDPDALKSVLSDVVQQLTDAVTEAKRAYEKVVSDVTSDGQVTDDERSQVDAAQMKFEGLEGLRAKYAGQLKQAREATEKSSSRQGSTIGSFYAKALRGLGATSVQERTLKANQETAQNTKKTVDLLRKQAQNALTFA